MSVGIISLKNIVLGKKDYVSYDVTLKIHDVVDTLYGFPGNGTLTYEQSLQLRDALPTRSATGFVERTKTYRNLSRNALKSLLQKKTGSEQEDSIRYLDLLWLKGFSNLTISFNY